MLERELRDFIRAVLDFRRVNPGASFEQANAETARMLGVASPIEGDGVVSLPPSLTRRRRGRGPSPVVLTKADAVAAVATYFESVGAGLEQAIVAAKRWLCLRVPRQTARDAMARFKANTSTNQYRIQALWACAVYRPHTTLPLPDSVAKTRKKRQRAAD